MFWCLVFSVGVCLTPSVGIKSDLVTWYNFVSFYFGSLALPMLCLLVSFWPFSFAFWFFFWCFLGAFLGAFLVPPGGPKRDPQNGPHLRLEIDEPVRAGNGKRVKDGDPTQTVVHETRPVKAE